MTVPKEKNHHGGNRKATKAKARKQKRKAKKYPQTIELPAPGTAGEAYFEHQASKFAIGRKSDFYLDNVHDCRVDIFDRTIHISGDPNFDHTASGDTDEPGVEYMMANRFRINLKALCEPGEKRPILVEIASCGGNWEEGMQIFSDILHCPVPVAVLSMKWARSMTSIIPLAADYSVIQPPTRYMIHHGTWGQVGLQQEIDTLDIQRRKDTELMIRLYAMRLKKSGGKFSRWSLGSIVKMLHDQFRRKIDVWLSSDQSVEWGFIDEVYDGDEKRLRAKVKHKNVHRREWILELLREEIEIEINVSPWKMLTKQPLVQVPVK